MKSYAGALLVTAAALLAAATNSTTTICADVTRVTLGSCGSSTCGEDQPCAQYPAGATTKCSDVAGSKCVVLDASCTYQCLDNTYNPTAKKWTLFVKDPKSVDVYAAAPVDKIATGVFSSDMHNMYGDGWLCYVYGGRLTILVVCWGYAAKSQALTARPCRRGPRRPCRSIASRSRRPVCSRHCT